MRVGLIHFRNAVSHFALRPSSGFAAAKPEEAEGGDAEHTRPRKQQMLYMKSNHECGSPCG
jgi:hypothetical protein